MIFLKRYFLRKINNPGRLKTMRMCGAPADGGMVVPSGFEPESLAPKAGMIDRYTTGLRFSCIGCAYLLVSRPGTWAWPP